MRLITGCKRQQAVSWLPRCRVGGRAEPAALTFSLFFLLIGVCPAQAQSILRVLPIVPTSRSIERPALLPVTQSEQPKFSLEIPAREQVFNIESEQIFLQKMRGETEPGKAMAELPTERIPPPTQPPLCRESSLPHTALLVPSLVCYRPLYFEDKNTERYGWSMGILQPFVSTGKFYANTLLLPFHMAVMPPWKWECNSGYFLPGDPVPYKLYLLP